MDGLIYAYNYPKSAGQRAYTDARLAQLAQQRAELRQLRLGNNLRKSSQDSSTHIERTTSRGSASQGSRHPSSPGTPRPRNSRKWSLPDISGMSTTMDNNLLVARTATGSSHGSGPNLLSAPQSRTASQQQDHDLLSNPFELRHGRRCLRDVPYPLPCDLIEMQRQNLKTLLSTSIFGGAVCSPKWENEAPKKVLEVGCGNAYWSSLCQEYFAGRGYPDVEFVGMDIAPVAPNLTKHGVKWKFVHHDMRRQPWPFEDGVFDLVMLKDLSLSLPESVESGRVLMECIRLLRPGGILEVWDSDHVIRSLTPEGPPPPSKKPKEQEVAEETGTFAVAQGHSFIPPQNKFIQRANKWIKAALDRSKLEPSPCVRVGEWMLQEDGLADFGQRRVAVPLGELRWERKAVQDKWNLSNGHDSPMSTGSRENGTRNIDRALTPDQAGLRQTALMIWLQMIESMEPMLKEVSGKNAEEWSHWWSSMMSELLDPSKAALTGECLEIGAWWGVKTTVEE